MIRTVKGLIRVIFRAVLRSIRVVDEMLPVHVLPRALRDTQLPDVCRLAKQEAYDEAARKYRREIRRDPTWSVVYGCPAQLASAEGFRGPFSSALTRVLETEALRRMIGDLQKAPELYHPSRFWTYFLYYNALQIDCFGVERFKRTVNKNYFNWTSDHDVGIQRAALQTTLMGRGLGENPGEEEGPTPSRRRAQIELLSLLWEYTKRADELDLRGVVREPPVGDPIGVNIDGRLITQDLCNSILEANFFLSRISELERRDLRILELGAGHGRIPAAILQALPDARVTVVDIPPALHVSQWYLSTVFPKAKVFPYRDFGSYAAVRDEMEAAQLVFLLPNQVGSLPDKCVDLFVNVSSLHEMVPPQIANWFDEVDRLAKWFYYKEYLRSVNVFDDIVIRREDYPEKPGWRRIAERISPVHPEFFECLLEIDPERRV